MFNKDNRLAVRQAARRDPGAHRRGRRSGVRGRRHGEVLRQGSWRRPYNAYETPFPDNLYKIYTEAETLVGRAVAGEITAEEAMKQAAEFADKTNGVKPRGVPTVGRLSVQEVGNP